MNLITARWWMLSVSVAATLLACADDLKATNNGDSDAASTLSIETIDKGAGVHETTVDASANTKYFDLDKPGEIADHGADWDLGFSRFKIKANGGDSGDGDVAVAKLEGQSFDDLSKAPSKGWVQDSDQISSESEGMDPNYGFLGPKPWYSYESTNHQLTPADYVYVVRSTKGDFFKVKMLGYYDKAGTAGFPRFQWAELEKPSGEIEIMEQSEGSGDAGATPDDETKDAGDKPSTANAAAFGCYDVKVHKCDCATDQAACEAAMGAWTDQCACDTK